jgi:hypothetical protein
MTAHDPLAGATKKSSCRQGAVHTCLPWRHQGQRRLSAAPRSTWQNLGPSPSRNVTLGPIMIPQSRVMGCTGDHKPARSCRKSEHVNCVDDCVDNHGPGHGQPGSSAKAGPDTNATHATMPTRNRFRIGSLIVSLGIAERISEALKRYPNPNHSLREAPSHR